MVKRNYSRKVLKRSLTRKRNTCPPQRQGFFWNVPPHKKGPKKTFAHKKGPKKAFDTGGPWGQVKWEPIRLTRGYSRKVWKKAWPKNGTPAPPLPRFFLERPTTQKGSKKSLHTQRHTKRAQKKPSTLEAHEAKSNGNPYVWQGAIPERSEKKPDQKTEHLPPHCQGFFGTSHHTKMVQKKPSHTKRVQKKPSTLEAHEAKWELIRLTRHYSRKVWKKNWPKNGTPAPPLPRFFWNVPPHKKGPKKAFTHKKGPKKAFDTGGAWGQVKWEPIRLTPAPTLPRFFWDVPPHKKGPKKAFAHKRSKKQGTIPERSEKSLTRTYHTKRVKKKPSEASRKKGPDQQNERLLPHWRHTGLSYGQPSKRVKKKPRRYRKKPSPIGNYTIFPWDLAKL